jgi:hypothetical protein
MKRFFLAALASLAFLAGGAPGAYALTDHEHAVRPANLDSGHGPVGRPDFPLHSERYWNRDWDRRAWLGYNWFWADAGFAAIWLGNGLGYVDEAVYRDLYTGLYYWIDLEGRPHWLD